MRLIEKDFISANEFLRLFDSVVIIMLYYIIKDINGFAITSRTYIIESTISGYFEIFT